MSYGQLLRCTQGVLRELKQHPAPQFQALRVTDLPTEILDNIVDLASPAQSKMLSCTCHILNDICQRHIFRTWRMKLHVFNLDHSTVDLPTLACLSRKDLERSAKFIVNNPRISHRVQKLVLADEWWVSRRAHPHENNPFTLGMGFYKSFMQIFASVLKSATNLHTLVLCSLELSLDFMRRVSEIPTLYTVELHFCHIPRAVRRKFSSDATFNCPQISNLRIYMDSSFQETHSRWYSLLLCSCLRTLSVIQFGMGPFPTPEQLFWKKCRLQNLERLSLDNTGVNDLVPLTKFLSRNSAAIRLTHFKLHVD
ncbi:hypothetical protein M413DRAFT_149560 [Hebeloma cylindrosporum]|uniref:F-box domain-containing protein n=1 Tax=Hebeloma cylindrosporum TaxID=76867 RepID=A0A0C3CB85_HEBCY|nr:hypothetical protein M413DRAFT_149560 [Hebeloma cylindrosporum h7]